MIEFPAFQVLQLSKPGHSVCRVAVPLEAKKKSSLATITNAVPKKYVCFVEKYKGFNKD